MYKMITTGLLCIAAVALKAQDAPIDSVDHTKSNTLGASSTVYTNDLVKYQSATILTGLQGRLKGLNVSPFRGMQLLRTEANTKSDIVGAIPNVGGGIYGDNSEFLISARGQSPIAIVDGVERDLYSIDPEAIESVTIQKDALSNMFLGMRSSRGALIITTKNPDAKGGFHLSLTGNPVQIHFRLINMLICSTKHCSMMASHHSIRMMILKPIAMELPLICIPT